MNNYYFKKYLYKMMNGAKKNLNNIITKFKRISFLLLLLFISISINSYNNDIRFERITKDDSLPNIRFYLTKYALGIIVEAKINFESRF